MSKTKHIRGNDGAHQIDDHDGPLTVHRRLEIAGTVNGPVEVLGGTCVVHGHINGNVDVEGGDLIVLGSVRGRVTNNSGSVEVSGSVGDLRGPPAYTRVLPGAKVGDHVIGAEPGAIDSWATTLAELDHTPLEVATMPAPAAEDRTDSIELVLDEPTAPEEEVVGATEPSESAPSRPSRWLRPAEYRSKPQPSGELDLISVDEPVIDDIASNLLGQSQGEVTASVRPLMKRERSAPESWNFEAADDSETADPAAGPRAALPPEDLTDASLLMHVNHATSARRRQMAALVLVALCIAVVLVLALTA